jgi:uncharacterized protein YndB with AHSA1/START domain
MTDIAVRAAMIVRRPPAEVFDAFADPDVTTRFWFTRSTGKMTPGAELQWDWEMFGVSAKLRVLEAEPGRRIRWQWDDEQAMTVEVRFTPHGPDGTVVEVTESGFSGSGDEAVSYAADSTGGYTIVLCGLKALLEHGVELGAVRDSHPEWLSAG